MTGTAWASAVGCEELGRLGLLDTSDCCALCHSAARYAPGRFFLGPCHAALPDGRTASVCCAGKRRLLGRKGT
ncbi:hypothetical protein GBA63_05730 [Rubrobacter tropicus]|uniref:Uncharacterized protein n=1 Tax=Rubrobacter tropicus TaxID=2653851 RepID=A0A6G8Q6U6_9ACTN|nr:hypothetical protein [Rubrobacter tropicus]QIN82201.1 hypothetical protein GBA63_05730 [Rubrobacter tropicus]